MGANLTIVAELEGPGHMVICPALTAHLLLLRSHCESLEPDYEP